MRHMKQIDSRKKNWKGRRKCHGVIGNLRREKKKSIWICYPVKRRSRDGFLIFDGSNAARIIRRLVTLHTQRLWLTRWRVFFFHFFFLSLIKITFEKDKWRGKKELKGTHRNRRNDILMHNRRKMKESFKKQIPSIHLRMRI